MTENLPAVPAARDVHFEVALDTEPDGTPVPVGETDAGTPDERLPVRPDWARPEQAKALAGRIRYSALCHLARTPEYAFWTAVWAPVGAWRLTWRRVHWWLLLEQHELRSGAAAAGDSREWMKLHKEAKETRKVRGTVLAVVAAAAALAVVLAWTAGGWAGRAALVTLVLAVLPWLAHHGRPEDRPIIRPVTVTPRFRVLNADVVLRAYYAAGLGSRDKPDLQVTFGSTMRREGEGSGVDVDLPYGKGLGDAMNAKDKIASGLDVTESQVFLHRDPTSYRRHHLWVADRDPLAVPVGKTPLLACKTTDIWKRAPLGLDERGQLVQFLLMWHSLLVGGMPRQGKSWTSRLLALFAALDPFVQLDVFDAGGKPDWRKFALVADSCAFGLTPTRNGKPPEMLLNTLMGLRADVEQRYERLSSLPTSVCPEGKLTRDIARDRRYGMPVRLLVLGEVQEYFLLGDISKAIAEHLVYLVKVAPGAGVIVLSDTQRPSGIGSGYMQTQFVNFRDQHQVRFALKTPSWGVSDLVLGDGAYSSGLDSSKLLEEYKGVGILRNAMNASPTVRCYYAGDPDAEQILLAARAQRERAGTLSGMALGETAPQAASVLADVVAVMGDLPGLHWDVIAPLLARQFPERHADATPESVSAQLRAAGVPSVDVKYLGKSRMGCRREHVMQAMDERGGR